MIDENPRDHSEARFIAGIWPDTRVREESENLSRELHLRINLTEGFRGEIERFAFFHSNSNEIETVLKLNERSIIENDDVPHRPIINRYLASISIVPLIPWRSRVIFPRSLPKQGLGFALTGTSLRSRCLLWFWLTFSVVNQRILPILSGTPWSIVFDPQRKAKNGTELTY